MASQAGKIPARLDGSPVPGLSDINVQGARNVTQRATVKGIRNATGQWKWQADLTFGLDNELNAFVDRILGGGPANLQFDVADGTFNLINGDANSLSFSSDQDGKGECKASLMFEGYDKVA